MRWAIRGSNRRALRVETAPYPRLLEALAETAAIAKDDEETVAGPSLGLSRAMHIVYDFTETHSHLIRSLSEKDLGKVGVLEALSHRQRRGDGKGCAGQCSNGR